MTNPYRVFVATLPDVCPADPRRMVFTADSGGRCEVFTWDAAVRCVRQVTDSADGTAHRAIDAEGYVWWFEEDATDSGHWWFQHFDGGPRSPGLPGAPAGRPHGLAVTADGTVAAAIAHAEGTTVVVGRRGQAQRQLWCAPGSLRLGGITPDGTLIALAAAADDPAAVRVVSREGRTVLALPGPGVSGGDGSAAEGLAGPTPAGTRLWCQGFSPRPGRHELLLVRDLTDGYVLQTWTPEEGLCTHRWCPFDTEISARWYPDRRALLVRQARHGRSLLHQVDLDSRKRVLVPTPAGSVLDAAPRAAGAVDYLWTDTAHAPVLRATDGMELPPCGSTAVVPGRHTDLWTPSSSGRVHTLLSLPERPGSQPPPAVFLIHGGPADHDRDAYDATVHSLVASGYAVARVNYRGSTGYGPRWQREFPAGVGHTQVEDLAAVRADLVAQGLVARSASALWGVSWGAYLVLLALGTRPRLWQAGIAVKPVADWAAAHRTSTPALRAVDVRLFGGTPDELPERYASSSPLTYAAEVTAPLLVVGATRDVKCPPGQIRSYLAALAAADVPHEAMWLETGHDGYDGAAHVAVLRRSLRFLHDRLPTAAPGTLTRPPASTGGPRSR
ncbi:S9 family peptidase [Streptomyces monashensis]|uniref:S9 family peptidase n=1 Tax=Streptomyces monashensis TaxID=1678012 RepID=A0A1S2QJJ7_9ACTN|nr:prolyl oligopeptidase family serine peptidase [Streptomyces monashensis]OIK06312.1 S9 family peptidase [Streptomyces monashensis]